MPFEDIKIIELNEQKTRKSDQAPAMFDVALQLSASPPSGWITSFNGGWKNSIWYSMKRDAWIEGANIIVTCVPDEVQPYHLPQLTRAVDEANKDYRKSLGQQQVRAGRENEQKRKDAEKISELKKTLKFNDDKGDDKK